MPEGMEVDKALLDKAVPLFKELNLTQEDAQKLIDLQSGTVQEGAQAQVEAHNQVLESWDKEIKADPEFGGDKFDENLGIAKQGLDAVGSDGLKDFLRESGAGSHPEVIKACN
jgi:hypothetical protein